MRRTGLMWVVLVSGCSLLVQFDPETQPCDSAGQCVTGLVTDAGIINYVCVDGLCRRSDGGVADGGVADGGVADSGVPDAGAGDAGCVPVRELCGDGRDNDCDSQTDCADSDCNGLGCDDRNACTMGETCSMNLCRGGTAVVCTNTTNTCQAMAGVCDTGTGGCTFTALANGTQCGPALSARCCTGTCIDISVNSANCGGCGLACAASQSCRSLNQSSCVPPEPAATSARCGCTAGAACPRGQTCSSAFICVPAMVSQCATGQVLGDAGISCGAFCRY